MVKYLLVLSMFFATSVFAGGAGGSWGEPTQPTKPAPTNDTGDYTGGGGKFGGGGAGGSWDSGECTGYVNGVTYTGTVANVCNLIVNNISASYSHSHSMTSTLIKSEKSEKSYICKVSSDTYYGPWYVSVTCTVPLVECPDKHLENGQCVPDDEPTPDKDKDKDKDKDNKDDNKECDATCKCKAELEAIRKAILSLKLDVDLSSLERKLDALISAIRNQKSVEVDLSNIESQLSAIHFAILASKYDDRQLQAKIDALTKQVTQTNAKLDTIIDTLNRPQQCSTNPFNKKICDFIDWFQGSIPPLDDNSAVSIDDGSRFDWQSIAQNNYLTLPSSCPFNPLFNVPFLGKAASIVFPMDIVCRGAVMLKVLILLWASFTSLRIIGDTPL